MQKDQTCIKCDPKFEGGLALKPVDGSTDIICVNNLSNIPLSNLQAGNTIQFTVTGSVNDPVPDTYYPYGATLTGLITSISSVNSTVWKITLSDNINFRATLIFILREFYKSNFKYGIVFLQSKESFKILKELLESDHISMIIEGLISLDEIITN